MFDKIKNMYKLQKDTKRVKKELANTHIEAEQEGIIVIINGEQEMVKVKIPPEVISNVEKLEEALLKAFNKAIKKSQQIAADQMKDVMKQMGF